MMTARLLSVMEFDCPFCGGRFGISETEYFIYHSDPPCETFERLDVNDFLRAVNLAMGNYFRGTDPGSQLVQ